MSEWAWLIALGMFLIALATFAFGWVAKILKGEGASDTAKEAKTEVAQARADLAAFKAEAARLVSDARAELAAFKTEAAGRFATIEMLEKSENRVADAINRLADRLDRVLEIREASRPAPRSRAVKS